MGIWWEAYQEMSIDQKEVAIRQYNRQRSKTRRKTVEVDEPKTTEIEPLVNVPEPRSRRAKKERVRADESTSRFIEKATAVSGQINADHPILKRKRVQRDLSQVDFGPTQ